MNERDLLRREELQNRRAMAGEVTRGSFLDDSEHYIQYLVEVQGVPEEITTQLWSLTNRIHQLTNLSDSDVRVIMMDVDDIFTSLRMSLPEWEYSYELDLTIRQLKTLFYSMIKRSYEGFERRMQTTQFRHVEYADDSEKPKTGIMGRIFGR